MDQIKIVQVLVKFCQDYKKMNVIIIVKTNVLIFLVMMKHQ